jgi:hypothetical protein
MFWSFIPGEYTVQSRLRVKQILPILLSVSDWNNYVLIVHDEL